MSRNKAKKSSKTGGFGSVQKRVNSISRRVSLRRCDGHYDFDVYLVRSYTKFTTQFIVIVFLVQNIIHDVLIKGI